MKKMAEMMIDSLKARFKGIFKADPVIVRSPGRINIIGEHTDYNDGFVLPAAIKQAVYVALSKRDDMQVHLYSQSYAQYDVASLSGIKKSEKGWANYVLGVIDQLIKNGHELSGFNIYIEGNVPLGAGLSSSAALECAVAFGLNHIFSLQIDGFDMARIAQNAEHEFAGVNCGIMDQFASVFGKKDQVMLLDCRSMAYEYIPVNLGAYKFLLLNTNLKHKLSESAYNQRRLQCEAGVKMIQSKYPRVQSLRDVSSAQLEALVKPEDEQVYSKCLYVVEEIKRTQSAAQKLRVGDLRGLGKLMFETHAGLSNLYQVSCRELDFLVDKVIESDQVIGARMMGGGFGGCTINLVEADKIDALIGKLIPLYQQEFGISLDAYIVEIGGGSSVVC